MGPLVDELGPVGEDASPVTRGILKYGLAGPNGEPAPGWWIAVLVADPSPRIAEVDMAFVRVGVGRVVEAGNTEKSD